jgi:hypothetical protein
MYCVFTYTHKYIHTYIHTMCMYACNHISTSVGTAILIIIEGRFQVFQRFPSSKLELKTVESCFVALNYYGNGSSFLSVDA